MKSVNITEVVTSLLKEYIQNSKRASEQLDIRLPHGNNLDTCSRENIN